MKYLSTIALSLILLSVLHAQPDKGNPGGAPAPFGFIEILIGAGALYGGKKFYDKRKPKS